MYANRIIGYLHIKQGFSQSVQKDSSSYQQESNLLQTKTNSVALSPQANYTN
jgi:hypothetical protein